MTNINDLEKVTGGIAATEIAKLSVEILPQSVKSECVAFTEKQILASTLEAKSPLAVKSTEAIVLSKNPIICKDQNSILTF